MAVKSAALLLLLPLLQEVGADWTTTVHTTLIVPNTVTPVVKFVTPPATPLSSTPSPLPLTYDHANSHKLRLTSVVTVPDGHIPTVHFSTITPSGKPAGTDGGSGGTAPPSVTTSPESANSGASSATPNEGGSSAAEETPTKPPASSGGVPPGGYSSSKPRDPNGSTTSGSHPKHTTTQPAVPKTTKSSPPAGTSGGSSESGSSDGPPKSQPNNTGTKGSNTSSSKHVGPGGSNTSGSPPKHTTTQPASPDTTKSGSPAGTSGSSSESGSPDGPPKSQPSNTGTKGSDTTSSKNVGPTGSTTNRPGGTTSSTPKVPASDSSTTKSESPSDSASTSHTPSETPDQSTTGPPSSSPTVKPSDQVSSVDLSSASDIQSAAASNSDIAEFAPTASPSQEDWVTMPATTTSGSPASTSSDSAIIALMLKNSYNNIDELKKDPKAYKKHIEDIDDHTSKYLSKTGYDASKSPCSGSKKRSSIEKRGLFDAVSSIAKSAVDATVDTASDIANSALSCVAPIVDDIKNVIPDDVDVKGITPEIENQVKKGTEYLDEISNIVEDMDEKKKDDDDDDDNESSSSKSDSSSTSSSSTKTCTSSTTYSDCTWDTIVTPVADSDTTTISVITSTQSCTTKTGCDEKPSTFETTSTVDACSYVSVQEAPAVGIKATSFSVSSTPGAGASEGSSATPHSTASPGSVPKTTGSSSTTKSSTKSSATPTTSAGPECRANYVVDQKDGWEYCEFECTEYTGKYSMAKSTSGQKSYQPCPYSRPPVGMSWSPDNEGPFTTTAKDGTVYSCDDSRYQDRNVGDSKSCVTSMESITRISSIYAAYTSSAESAASASSASESSVSASKASASAASASAASASAAAATPYGYAYIVFNSGDGAGFSYQVMPSLDAEDPDICNIVPVATTTDGTYYDLPGSIDIDHGVLDGCTYKDDEIKCDDYTLPCVDFKGKDTNCGQARVQCGRDVKT